MKIVWGRSIGWNMSFNGIAKFRPKNWTPMKITQVIENGADCYPWREVFVWFPWVTTISGKRIWWEKVFKRKVWVVWGQSFHMEPEVQYATLFEVLTYKDEDYFNME
jgi:hypothetical protein